MKTIKPANHQVFAKKIEASEKTASGIFVPKNAVDNLSQAEVINVGALVKEFAQHDQVIYREYSATTTKLDNQEYLLIADEDILGKIIEVEG
jgi:chaperonin GroES